MCTICDRCCDNNREVSFNLPEISGGEFEPKKHAGQKRNINNEAKMQSTRYTVRKIVDQFPYSVLLIFYSLCNSQLLLRNTENSLPLKQDWLCYRLSLYRVLGAQK